MDKLITYLDKLFKKDELSEVYERYVLFNRFERTSQQKMEDFILEFARRYNRIMQKDMKLPPSVLAFKLLDASKISHKDRQLVLTAVDYTKKDQLFEQMKSALRKFNDEQSMSMSMPMNESSATAAVKLEPGLLTENEEALFLRNRYQQNRYQQRRSYKSDDRPRQGQKTNPIGFNGKPNKCKICKSILLYAKNCLHKRNQEEEDISLYVGPKDDDMCLFTSEARNSAVLDSECTSTVAGQNWVDCYL